MTAISVLFSLSCLHGGDHSLTHHLLNSAHNATYLSPTVHNEIINTCNDMILAELVCKVNAAHCFSVLADETADVSAVEQFSLGVRYIDCTLGKVTEDFFAICASV